MITKTEIIPEFKTFSETLGYSPENSLFFDIETTGFSPACTILFLVGVIFRDGQDWRLEQYLAETPADEERVLAAFLTAAAGHSTLIHFNGSTFDLPYLLHKAEKYHVPHNLSEKQSLDLYQKFRPLKSLLSLQHMNQSALEAFLGWQREDRLTGKHMVSLFHKFSVSGEPGLRDLLLLHNHDDMVGMTHLPGLAAYLALFKGSIGPILSAEYKKSADTGTCQELLEISFLLETPVSTPLSVSKAYRLVLRDSYGILSIPLYNGSLYHFFRDYKNYYYLPLEDQAIHKSVASFVDKSYREPAKASNCYIKKSGLFLPQPEELFTPAFQYSFEDKKLYFPFADDLISNQGQLSSYVSAVLRSFC